MTVLRYEFLNFAANGGAAGGYLAMPAEGGPHPGVIVIQEWWGLNPNICDIANRLAAEGYAALAPDLFNGELTREPDVAQKLMMKLQEPDALAVMNGAVAALQARDDVDADRIGATGFCLGGGMTLLLAMHNPAIKAAAPFYGTPGQGMGAAAGIAAAVEGFFAGKDDWVDAEAVETIRSALAEHGVRHNINVYENSEHGFFNDTNPGAHDPQAAADAWQKLTTFFAAELKP